MTSLQRFLLAISLGVVVLGWFGNPVPVFACSCVMTSPGEQLSNATAVFVGTVKDVVARGGKDDVSFSVSETRKGVVAELVTVATASQESACGFDFVKGNTYTVYAYDENDQLSTGLCTGTTLLAEETPTTTSSNIPQDVPVPPVVSASIIASNVKSMIFLFTSIAAVTLIIAGVRYWKK